MPTKVYESPSRSFDKSLFLAGGITGCPDWQSEIIELLDIPACNLTIYNPRRENFPIGDPNAAEKQIIWEYERLMKADLVSFWFPCETLCPITLFELGKMLGIGKNIEVGCHPSYGRKQDIEIQMELTYGKPPVIARTIEHLADNIKKNLFKGKTR
jgi:hypothetical protein